MPCASDQSASDQTDLNEQPAHVQQPDDSAGKPGVEPVARRDHPQCVGRLPLFRADNGAI